MNSIGSFVPSVFIVTRKRFKNEPMDKAPPGSKAFGQGKGWVPVELF